jgi:death-on-curing protein
MTEPVWLTRSVVEALHADQIREHGGKPGVRDVALLKSALARPQRTWEYDKDADLAALAAEYGFGLAKSHPFADGNKRIAFVATNVFLLINGYEIDAPEPEVVNAMVRLADGRLTRSRFAQWIRKYLVKYKE